VVSSPATWQLIAESGICRIASDYLRCNPIITSVEIWHVAAIAQDSRAARLYSSSAQTYHYDLDWIRFIKFFVSLTNTGTSGGPFEFIPKTHRKKNKTYFNDGRFDQLPTEELDPVIAIDEHGSIFAADTCGIHRDGRALHGFSRHVLQVEFAVSALGAKFQYNDNYRTAAMHLPWNAIPHELKKERLLDLYRLDSEEDAQERA
jgi:hypothetical protein